MEKRVRAIIIENGSLLTIHRIKSKEEYWVFPGGGLEEVDSSPQEGLKRECSEELGVDVEIGNLFIENEGQSFYLCRIISGEIGTGKGPEFDRDPLESGTYEPVWIPLSELGDKKVLPARVKDEIVLRFK